MKRLSFAFLGSTNYSKELLLFLIEKALIPKVVFSTPKDFKISYSERKVKNYNYFNLRQIAEKNHIPYYEVDVQEGRTLTDYHEIISKLDLDLILVLGWYYMIPKSIRNLPKMGSWGIHASLLPEYAGGAPLVWAIIKDEKKTGVTLFRMEGGVDDGDIISQRSFKINHEDDIKMVYDKAIMASKEILIETLFDISSVKFTPQDKSKIEVYPQRKPEDGEINLSMTAKEIYNFIRAQSEPYPGAYLKTIDNKKIIIEKAKIEDL